MRLSVDPIDPGYCRAGFGAKVFLDGVEISHVVTADEERRMVLVVKTDEDGRVVLNAARDAVETEWRFGGVRLDLPRAMNAMLTGRSA